MTPGTRVLGLDPGFAAIGWAVVELGPAFGVMAMQAKRDLERGQLVTDADVGLGGKPERGGDRLVSMGVIRTQPSPGKRKTLAVDDNVRRAREIYGALQGVVTSFEVRAVCAEAMSFPRSSSVAAKVAMTWGVVVSICEEHTLPLLQASPQMVKQAVCGSKSASKEEVAYDVRRRLGNEIEGYLSSVAGGLHEHAYDAAAVALTCLSSDVVRVLRGAA